MPLYYPRRGDRLSSPDGSVNCNILDLNNAIIGKVRINQGVVNVGVLMDGLPEGDWDIPTTVTVIAPNRFDVSTVEFPDDIAANEEFVPQREDRELLMLRSAVSTLSEEVKRIAGRSPSFVAQQAEVEPDVVVEEIPANPDAPYNVGLNAGVGNGGVEYGPSGPVNP